MMRLELTHPKAPIFGQTTSSYRFGPRGLTAGVALRDGRLLDHK
jgi:hypothetical protein